MGNRSSTALGRMRSQAQHRRNSMNQGFRCHYGRNCIPRSDSESVLVHGSRRNREGNRGRHCFVYRSSMPEQDDFPCCCPKSPRFENQITFSCPYSGPVSCSPPVSCLHPVVGPTDCCCPLQSSGKPMMRCCCVLTKDRKFVALMVLPPRNLCQSVLGLLSIPRMLAARDNVIPFFAILLYIQSSILICLAMAEMQCVGKETGSAEMFLYEHV
ncbi:uncharacterized protein LOC124461759 [Drosophila willistoni]|uniref:uncharacterized protein LOC124461759 n=1 Tax=Drosophila willistoni TaxID=7260 RepID=UPI001F0729CB|nr:uncharacterized protein LOC124461759 [Drosophila willistoni]